MKKLTLSLATILVSAALSHAQYSDLVSLGSNSWTIDTSGSSSIFSQSSTSVSFNTAVTSGEAVQGALVTTPVNWSAFNAGNGTQGSSTDFAVNMSFTGGSNPNMGFNVQVWNADFSDNMYFAGNTATATSTAAYIPLTFDSGNTAILANPGNIIISWNDGGTPSVTMNSLAAVPEPSTYALMALGGLVLFFIARRRKAQQA
jgi:hypothetical protein